MPVNRLTAWLRPFTTLAALAAVLSLAACGGGGGAPNNPYDSGNQTLPLAVFPSIANVYAGQPVTLAVSGGNGPFSAFSSDQSVIAVEPNVSGNSITLLPNRVTADTPVTITIRDARGVVVSAQLTVKASMLINSLTLKADNFSQDCPSSSVNSTDPTDTQNSTWICSGQTGSVAVRVQGGAGVLASQYVRFDIVQGDFQIFTEGPGQPESFARCYIVPTDQNGNAVARIRANPSAPQQLVIVQASALGSTPPPTQTPVCDPATVPTNVEFVRGVFVIQQHGDITGTQMSVVPDTVTITGPDTQTCSTGVTSTFFIFGGQPPYVINNTFPQALTVTPTLVTTNGAGFNVVTRGVCVNPATLSITDAAGHTTTVTLNNTFGSTPPNTIVTPNPIAIGPLPLPTLTCSGTSNSATIFVSGGGTVTQTGNGAPTVKPATQFLLGTNQPDVLDINPPGAVAPLTAVTLTRDPTQPATGTVTLTVFDGTQSQSFNIPVAPTCP